MRKSGNKKREISQSRRTIAMCLATAMMLGSFPFLAFADEIGEPVVEDTVVETEAPLVEEEGSVTVEEVDEEAAVEAEPEIAEIADESETDADVNEETAVEESEVVTEENQHPQETEQAAVATEEVTTGSAAIHAYAATTKEWYIGDRIPAFTFYKCRDTAVVGSIGKDGVTLSSPTESRLGYEFAGIKGLYSCNSTPVGLRSAGGSGTAGDPYILYAFTHAHSFDISTSGTTVTVSCTARACPYTTDKEYNVTIAASDAVYSGSAVEATLTVDSGFPAEVTVGDVTYVGTGDTSYESSTTAPADAGTYTASVTVSQGSNTATVSADFEIEKADSRIIEYPELCIPLDTLELLANDFPVNLVTYPGVVEGGTLLYSTDGDNFSDSLPVVSEPGEYVVSIYVRGDKNHNDTRIQYSRPFYVSNYAFTEGKDATWDKEKDAKNPLTFTIKRSRLDDLTFDNVEAIYVDGKAVPESSYTLEKGSAIITLNVDFLKTLGAGKHSFKVDFSDPYSLETTITVTAPKSAPQTGEYAGMIVLVIGGVMMAAGAAFVIKAKKA